METDATTWKSHPITLAAMVMLACGGPPLPGDEPDDPAEALGTGTHGLGSADALSRLLMRGSYRVTQGYAPNRGHAGIDYGGTGDGVTSVYAPAGGTLLANTEACGKVAIHDGRNTLIASHLTARTSLAVGATIAAGAYLGKASRVEGGGCRADGPHLHFEIRTGSNATMADPAADNRTTTLDPTTYDYAPAVGPHTYARRLATRTVTVQYADPELLAPTTKLLRYQYRDLRGTRREGTATLALWSGVEGGGSYRWSGTVAGTEFKFSTEWRDPGGNQVRYPAAGWIE